VYQSTNDGQNWALFGKGLPLTTVTDLELVPQSGVLAAATFGRGAWEILLPAPTSVTLDAPRALSLPGHQGTFTATVRASGSGTPSGTVTFQDGTTVLGTAPLDSAGRATLAVALLAVGDHAITAVYGGDGAFGASTSAVLTSEVGTLEQRFVARAYLDLLGRPVDSAGLALWTGLVDQGVSRTEVALRIEASPEYQAAGGIRAFLADEIFRGSDSLEDLVQGFYQRLLGRDADLDGLSLFTGQLQAGAADEEVIAELIGSDEYLARLGP
jgi:hypothetical protein